MAGMAAGSYGPGAGVVSHHCPNYDIFGRQHHRVPFVEKSAVIDDDIRHHRWLQPTPGINTRAKLAHARQAGRVPDSTYDFDGDGVVGEVDYFIGKSFDKDSDGRLTTGERDQARQALEQGWLTQNPHGTESQEARATFAQSRRNMISAYDRSPKKDRSQPPLHSSRTSMNLSRQCEAKASGVAFGERYAAECAPILEPPRPTHETEPRACPLSNIRDRAEADHQASRVRGGLLPMSSLVNPEREMKYVGMDYVDRPYFGTRGQLVDTRKELMRRDCEELALKAEEKFIPNSVRKVERQVREFDYRRLEDKPTPMTMTRLQDQRRRDRIEHDMRNFTQPHAGKEYPRFSDNPEMPFWRADQGPEMQMMGATAPPAVSRSVSEPALKVTDVPWGHEKGHSAERDMGGSPQMHHAAGRSAASAAEKLGSKTVKRWTAESIERGEGRNKPRLFDNIQPVRIGPKDLESLDITSSMEPIRNAATAKLRNEGTKNQGAPKRSRMWADPTMQVPGISPQEEVKQRAAPRNIIQSEPSLRTAVQRDEIANEPRFFGSTTHIQRDATQTAVRSGGFQRCPSTGQPQQQKTGGRSKGQD